MYEEGWVTILFNSLWEFFPIGAYSSCLCHLLLKIQIYFPRITCDIIDTWEGSQFYTCVGITLIWKFQFLKILEDLMSDKINTNQEVEIRVVCMADKFQAVFREAWNTYQHNLYGIIFFVEYNSYFTIPKMIIPLRVNLHNVPGTSMTPDHGRK